MVENLVKQVIENGGRIVPLIVPPELAKGTGQMNPSLFIDQNEIVVNLRNVQYVMMHSENTQTFQCIYGPLIYMNPENDVTLRTFNFVMKLNLELEIKSVAKVDTSLLDITPVWEFIGLEDARIVLWNHRWYLCGVRRDTKPDGEGRMELSEIRFNKDKVREIHRNRIEPPGEPTYCEKNWMPILDMPFHFVKWSNPTQVVVVDKDSNSSSTVFLGEKLDGSYRDFRGGSSVIPYKDGHLAIVHEVELFKDELGRKDANYYHRFIHWDKDWNVVNLSPVFNFLTGRIEFCCGLGILNDKMYFSFGFQDNAAYIVEAPLNFMEEFING